MGFSPRAQKAGSLTTGEWLMGKSHGGFYPVLLHSLSKDQHCSCACHSFSVRSLFQPCCWQKPDSTGKQLKVLRLVWPAPRGSCHTGTQLTETQRHWGSPRGSAAHLFKKKVTASLTFRASNTFTVLTGDKKDNFLLCSYACSNYRLLCPEPRQQWDNGVSAQRSPGLYQPTKASTPAQHAVAGLTAAGGVRSQRETGLQPAALPDASRVLLFLHQQHLVELRGSICILLQVWEMNN